MGKMADDMRRLRDEIDRGRAQRRDELDRIRGDVLETLADARVRRIEQGAAMREELRDYVGRVARQTHELMDGFAERGAERREELAELRLESAQRLGRVRADLEEMRAVWAGLERFEPVAPEPSMSAAKHVPRPTPEPPRPARVDVRSSRSTKRPSVPDDLERIVGVGPSTAELLSQAGLTTFDAIAESSPKELEDVLGDLARFANVDHWIRQAEEFARV